MMLGRPRKPLHTDAERAGLAARLQATHEPGMPVATWVRLHHAELTALTKGPRSWS